MYLVRIRAQCAEACKDSPPRWCFDSSSVPDSRELILTMHMAAAPLTKNAVPAMMDGQLAA
jgi:hypothetical protein